MSKTEIIDKITEWIPIALKGGGIVILLVYMKRIFKVLKEIFFGKEGYDYREFMGAVSMAGFIGMLWKHFSDNSYEVSLPLLAACLLTIFVLAGIKEGTQIMNKYIGNKYGNENNNTDPKV